MTAGPTASALAAGKVAAVRDSPRGRLELLANTYNGPYGSAPHHLRFRRAAVSFMRWQQRRGLLNPLDGPRPGSPWWRAVNERLLFDGCQAVEVAGGAPGRGPLDSTTSRWAAFVRKPTGPNWYRAHNASIVAGYLDNRDLAEEEGEAERFFLNVVLVRVLYAHALNTVPRLALSRMAVLARVVGDPRLGMAGAFLSLGRVLPDRYPLEDDVAFYLGDERGLGRLLDYAVIVPRLQRLYEWSALELGQPGLIELVEDGSPVYAWPLADRNVWRSTRDSIPEKLLTRLTS